MGVECYCNFHPEPGSIPVPQLENSVNYQKNLKNNNSQPNDQDAYNKISTQNNINEQRIIKNENPNSLNNKNNNINGGIIKNLTEEEFEKVIIENSKEITEEKFLLLIKGKIKEIENELGEINQSKKKEYISKMNKNIIYKSPLYFTGNKYTYFGTWLKNSLQKEGWGILIDEKGNKYEGGFQSDKLDGYCRIISVNGDYFEGEIKMGIIEGDGIFFQQKNRYYIKVVSKIIV